MERPPTHHPATIEEYIETLDRLRAEDRIGESSRRALEHMARKDAARGRELPVIIERAPRKPKQPKPPRQPKAAKPPRRERESWFSSLGDF